MVAKDSSANRIVAGGLFALFCALVIAALAVFGVISMTLGHIFMIAAALVGTLLICTEAIPSKKPKHKFLWTITLCLGVYGADFAIMKNKNAENARATPTANISVRATYDESPHNGKDENGFTWRPNQVAVWVVISNSGSGPLEHAVFNVVIPDGIGIVSGSEVLHTRGCSSGLPPVPTPQIRTSQGIQEEEKTETQEVSNTFVVTCLFLDAGQSLPLKFATATASFEAPDFQMPTRSFPRRIIVRGITDVRGPNGLVRVPIKEQNCSTAKSSIPPTFLQERMTRTWRTWLRRGELEAVV